MAGSDLDNRWLKLGATVGVTEEQWTTARARMAESAARCGRSAADLAAVMEALTAEPMSPRERAECPAVPLVADLPGEES